MKKREIHGLRKTPEYKIWSDMRQRCNNKNRAEYARYGGRGLSVCQEWENSFKAFYEDMGPRPTPKHSIDRIDNNGNYTPVNCQWATSTQQSRNRGLFNVTHNGEYAEDAAIRLGITQSSFASRLRRGWSLEKAFTTPSCGWGGARR